MTGNIVYLCTPQLEKTSRPGRLRHELRLPSSPAGPLCLASVLEDYVTRTEEKRLYHLKAEGTRPASLLISNTKPYQAVQSTTVARWLLLAMSRAGIDTASYKSHSTRSASASSLVSRGFSVKQILHRGNWSEKSRTFAVYYNRA